MARSLRVPVYRNAYIYWKNIADIRFPYVPKFKEGTTEADVYRTHSQTVIARARMRSAMCGASSVMCAKLNKANWDVSYAFV